MSDTGYLFAARLEVRTYGFIERILLDQMPHMGDILGVFGSVGLAGIAVNLLDTGAS